MPARVWWSLLGLLILFTLARVTTTHRVFSQTADEPWHLVAGYDALTKWSMTADLHHPPLARVFFALPFLGTPEPPPGTTQERGNALLLRNDRYTQNIARARLGNLAFLGLGILIVALWARHLFSPVIGIIAALMFASLPPVLAHGGVATTDMALAAMMALALYVFTLTVEEPTWKRVLLLGLVVGAGMLSKYSFPVYFAATALLVPIMRRRLPSPRVVVSVAVAVLVVWGAYRFTFGTVKDADSRGEAFAKQALGSSLPARIPVPAPLYFMGLLEVKDHDINGHKAYLFGEQRIKGWWYYFPVAIFYKTPLPFLFLALAGCVALVVRRTRVEIVLMALAILAVAMTANLNLGVRHVLPIYAPLSMCAAFALVDMGRYRIVVAALLGWLVIGSAVAHPDYLPWFNAFAGRHPERILSDSNIDWGQDVLRLVRYARRERLPHLTVSLAGTTPLDRIGLPPITILDAWTTLHGWVAVSEFHLALGRGHSAELRAWVDEWFPDDRPYIRIGKSIRLYRFD